MLAAGQSQEARARARGRRTGEGVGVGDEVGGHVRLVRRPRARVALDDVHVLEARPAQLLASDLAERRAQVDDYTRGRPTRQIAGNSRQYDIALVQGRMPANKMGRRTAKQTLKGIGAP
jgi:hypothetical protein